MAIPMPDEVQVDPIWRFSPDGLLLAVSFVPGGPSTSDPVDRPTTLDLWDVPPR
jgi:hypothetical protein